MKRFALWLMVAAGLVIPVRAETELITNVYVVPPPFLNSILNAPSAKSVLEAAGIAFPEGASAIYNAATSQLIVRNTEDQMKLVATYVESVRDKVEKQIYVSVREMRFHGELADLLKSATAESKPGDLEVNERVASLFDFTNAALDKPRGPSTFDSEASFHAELGKAPKPDEDRAGERQVRMTGVLTDPQLQVMVRQLARLRVLDIESLPSVMVRSGQPGMTRKQMQRYGFIAVLGADEFTIDLRLFLPEAGKPLYDEGATNFEPTAVVTIWDGQTVVVAEKTANSENRLVFITATLVDPAGMPVTPKPTASAPDESKLK